MSFSDYAGYYVLLIMVGAAWILFSGGNNDSD